MPRKRELGLLLAATVIISLSLINLYIAQDQEITTEVAWVIGGFIGVFGIAHLAICWLAPHADQIMLPVAALLNGLGLVMIYRLDLASGNNLASRQVMWSLVAVTLMILVLFFLRDYAKLTHYSYILGLLGLILLALPLVWPSRMNADANIWISIGPFSVQPGEFSKILLLLFFAQLLVNKRTLFSTAGYRILGVEFPRLRDLGPILGVWGIAILIMAGENDFGPALLLFSTVLGMLYLATGRTSWLIIGSILVAIGGTAIYQISDKIQARVTNFMDPIAHYDTTGYQLSQSLFAMSSGGLSGTGLGAGHPELIPVVHSDFILAAIGEELGLIGLSAVLILFAIFITRGMRTALLAKDSYGKLVASGLSLTLAIQLFVVTAGITALIPMTGLTTPFMSQGGSSLMANYILLGIILRISHSTKNSSTMEA
ncbi:FtsW/RodA/SpoVE family cell cycle protein [Corynebacterium kutscheri]|uniref:Bacterial cell division membrane protein n=1 Tax=Corynebacterium kutscheri TaxID=35755 RepID=A0A0F6TCE8_9CORY|nr:FtsW/RodA/SpoVE family cell cycle protein [Corynebacterium kutscheri]AKE40276.1 bacterial cell division membrane protein [Corynebacterium kutscheri]VEH05534.1 cell division protein [Corynebacterium kutscheri]VEH10668.1 cell division protein [Corynebacterium kutscheri]